MSSSACGSSCGSLAVCWCSLLVGLRPTPAQVEVVLSKARMFAHGFVPIRMAQMRMMHMRSMVEAGLVLVS